MRVLAIDPGPEKSAFIIWGKGSYQLGHVPNRELLGQIIVYSGLCDFIAIEMIASYGMAVGKEVFETCRWIGRFEQAANVPVYLVYRKDIKLHLCHSVRAKDANVRQALIDKYGAPGTKKNPGPTFGITGDIWSALAVADYMLPRVESACEMIKKALK